jgi:hypothetical protein
MNVAVLKTGLFPDCETVEAGVEHLLPNYNVYIYDTNHDDLQDEDWDQAIDEIMACERLIVI